jgi:hypothetical protein
MGREEVKKYGEKLLPSIQKEVVCGCVAWR